LARGSIWLAAAVREGIRLVAGTSKERRVLAACVDPRTRFDQTAEWLVACFGSEKWFRSYVRCAESAWRATAGGGDLALDRRQKILAGLDVSRCRGVEIGPLHAPIVSKRDGNVLYVDYTDADTLRRKYANNPIVDVSQIVDVDAYWGAQSLGECLAQHAPVDYVIASHVLEHVPDLITWLKEIRAILSPRGRLKLALPDRRYTFDYLRRESQLVDVLNAYLLKARAPLPIAILDYILNTTAVDNVKAWTEGVSPQREAGRFESALSAARDAIKTGSYHDAHCWVFTCDSFKTLMADIADVGLLPFACDQYYDTELYQIEFFVSLRPCDDPKEAAASFRSFLGAGR